MGIVRRKESDDEVRKGLLDTSTPEVEIFPEYSDAVEGLEGFSHVFVLGYFHKLRTDQMGQLKVRPKRLVKFGLKLEDIPLVGDFALDSPTRPNPIGLSLVKLLQIRDGRRLVVSGLDFFDSTPVIDIKPYQAGYRVDEYKLPRWNTELANKAGLSPSESI